ncbi:MULTISPECIES: nitrilase-related carbon-nitrogen hydrolase [unclassified Streptomyces]|uniref:nitrilase-related carbon-nitrogen hydrolase n=1 Tax=unclassified Streptomyces TaxID=2593676 RepID=UPI002DD91514|nr:nitrilase-related carbon-nitrogen hydrolase [Streptomyces sp. NBC_01750]WSB01173.1 amidohydrolase [Streptomyces sp. NBC_01794]WSD34473.1 amidohydrolase [Streptomyces sp. NBC_01750]
MRVALAQTDCALGEVDQNLRTAREQIEQAVAQGADLVVFPELSLHGYHLGALKRDTSVEARDPRLLELGTLGTDVLVGFHEHTRLRAHNTSAYYSGGELLHAHRKLYLPNYLAWEERKHVSPGQSVRAYDLPRNQGRGATLVCNDAWQPVLPWLAVQDGAEVVIVPANSAASLDPEAMDTGLYWDSLLSYTARMLQCWVVFVNRVGSENGASFWGGSRVVDPRGAVVAQAPKWEPGLVTVDIDIHEARRQRRAVPLVAEARLGLIDREVRRLIDEGGDS